MSMDSESAAIRAARAGEADGLAWLYRAHGGRLLGICERMLGARADAEDVVHDVFVGLPEALGKYREDGRFPAWLTRVAVRLALMRLRKRRRRREVAEVEVAGGDEAERLAVKGTIEAALAALPDDLRAVVVLRSQGFSHAEVGETLGIRAHASEMRYHRALKAMREVIGE